jgi:hypothetical protein
MRTKKKIKDSGKEIRRRFQRRNKKIGRCIYADNERRFGVENSPASPCGD